MDAKTPTVQLVSRTRQRGGLLSKPEFESRHDLLKKIRGRPLVEVLSFFFFFLFLLIRMHEMLALDLQVSNSPTETTKLLNIYFVIENLKWLYTSCSRSGVLYLYVCT
jgi:hypothetical protein